MQAGYFSTAWTDIKNSPGWFGKVCLLGLIMLIPIIGPIVTVGYAYGWARDMAWNVHNPLPARAFGNEDGRLYSRGFFVIIIGVVFGMASLFCSSVLGLVGAGIPTVIGAILRLVLLAFEMVVAIVATVLGWIGAMRTSIYGRLSAGFQVRKIWEMFKQDTNGMLRIVGMSIVLGLIVSVVVGIITTILSVLLFGVLMAMAPSVDWEALAYQFQNSAYYGIAPNISDSQAVAIGGAVLAALGVGTVAGLVFSYVVACFAVWAQLMIARALGYWTRQFDVASWRGQDDPMPFELGQPLGSFQVGGSYEESQAQQAREQYRQAQREYAQAQHEYEQQQAAQRAYENQRKQEEYERAYEKAAAEAEAAAAKAAAAGGAMASGAAGATAFAGDDDAPADLTGAQVAEGADASVGAQDGGGADASAGSQDGAMAQGSADSQGETAGTSPGSTTDAPAEPSVDTPANASDFDAAYDVWVAEQMAARTGAPDATVPTDVPADLPAGDVSSPTPASAASPEATADAAADAGAIADAAADAGAIADAAADAGADAAAGATAGATGEDLWADADSALAEALAEADAVIEGAEANTSDAPDPTRPA